MRSFIVTLLTATLIAVGVSAKPSSFSRKNTELQSPASHQDIPTPIKREEHEVHTTNAQRFARGLPPLKPKPGRRAANRRSDPSSCSTTTLSGIVRLQDYSGNSVGYIGRSATRYGGYGRTTILGEALHISFEISSCSSARMDIVATNGPYAGSANKYVGAGNHGLSNTDNDIGPGSSNNLVIGGTGQTPADSPPTLVGSSFNQQPEFSKKTESAIWRYNPGFSSLTAKWINSDGSSPQFTYCAYLNDGDSYSIRLTGDLPALASSTGAMVVPVTFIFVPN